MIALAWIGGAFAAIVCGIAVAEAAIRIVAVIDGITAERK